MNDTIKQQNDFTGVTAWHNAGFTGKGVRVWNMEDRSDHGSGTRQRILDAAPDADVTSASHYLKFSNGVLLEEHVHASPMDLAADLFCQMNGFDIVTASLAGNQKSTEEARRMLYGGLRRKYNLTMFNSAGNDGSDGVKGGRIPETEAIYTGACMAFKSNYDDLRMWNYSSIGDEEDEVDFSTFTGGLNGTSFSTPYLAGIAALLMSRYGKMTSAEVYQYLKMIARPIPTGHPYKENYDLWSGYGVPILPDPKRKLVRMVIGSKTYMTDGQECQMDTAPFIKDNRTFVPIAFVAIALGAQVRWFPMEQRVSIIKDDRTVVMEIGKQFYTVWTGTHATTAKMDTAPFIKNSRTQVPLAFAGLALGCKVSWVETERKVMILEA